MSDDNRAMGQYCYATGDSKTREWFHQQWKIWPARTDSRLTTNISFHHGGVLAFRIEHGRDPEMSRDFKSNVDWYDAREGERHGLR